MSSQFRVSIVFEELKVSDSMIIKPVKNRLLDSLQNIPKDTPLEEVIDVLVNLQLYSTFEGKQDIYKEVYLKWLRG